MKIQKINLNTTTPAFKRRLEKNEEQEYSNTIKSAYDYLGTKEVSMIVHGTSFPQSENDIGTGSPYGKVAAQLIPFELLHGFNSIQLGPTGELSSPRRISPYESSVGSNNYLFIDFDKLTEDDYANILDKEIIEEITNHPDTNSKRNYAYSDFPEAFANYEYLMDIAYKNFKKSYNDGNFKAFKLNEEYKDYMRNNDIWKYGLFHVLTNHYGTEDYTKWDYIDRNLIQEIENNNMDAINRYLKINSRSKKELEKYNFGQFILNKQIKENTLLRQNYGFKYISDMLVGFSPADEWTNQDIFLKGYSIGCPYGGPDGGMQKWNVPVIDPKKLFNKDGSLAQGGEYLKNKLDKALTNFDNVRIDHALGLVDPYIYEKNGVRAGNVSTMPDIDPDHNYEKVLEKIVIPTLEKHGLDINNPVWEDLVTETPVFNRIYHQEFKIPGLTPLEYSKGENNQNSENWLLVGSHDSDPAIKMIKKDWIKNNEAWNPLYLAGYLNSAHDSSKYCEKIANDDSERVKAKFAELFASGKKIQISFADFFGINKTYNEGGNDKNPNNWKLRLNNNYEDTYYKNLASKKPTAINLPEILKLAVRAKADMNTVKDIESDQNPQEIIDNLDKFEKILKE